MPAPDRPLPEVLLLDEEPLDPTLSPTCSTLSFTVVLALSAAALAVELTLLVKSWTAGLPMSSLNLAWICW